MWGEPQKSLRPNSALGWEEAGESCRLVPCGTAPWGGVRSLLPSGRKSGASGVSARSKRWGRELFVLLRQRGPLVAVNVVQKPHPPGNGTSLGEDSRTQIGFVPGVLNRGTRSSLAS